MWLEAAHTARAEGADGGELDAAAAEAARAAAAAVRSARPGIGAVANAITDVRRNTTKYADSVESVYRCAPAVAPPAPPPALAHTAGAAAGAVCARGLKCSG